MGCTACPCTGCWQRVVDGSVSYRAAQRICVPAWLSPQRMRLYAAAVGAPRSWVGRRKCCFRPKMSTGKQCQPCCESPVWMLPTLFCWRRGWRSLSPTRGRRRAWTRPSRALRSRATGPPSPPTTCALLCAPLTIRARLPWRTRQLVAAFWRMSSVRCECVCRWFCTACKSL